MNVFLTIYSFKIANAYLIFPYCFLLYTFSVLRRFIVNYYMAYCIVEICPFIRFEMNTAQKILKLKFSTLSLEKKVEIKNSGRPLSNVSNLINK